MLYCKMGTYIEKDPKEVVDYVVKDLTQKIKAFGEVNTLSGMAGKYISSADIFV